VSGCVEVDTIDVDTDTDTGNENAQQERTDFVGGDIFVKKTVYCEEPATLEGEYCLKPVIGNVTATQLYVGVVAADFACWEQRTGNTISGECEVEIRNDEDEVIYSESFEQKQSVQDCQNDREREMLCGFQFDASIMNPGVYQLDVSYIDQYSGNTMEVKNTEVIIERTLDEQGNAFFDGAFYNFTYPGNWRKSKVGTDLAYQPTIWKNKRRRNARNSRQCEHCRRI
jgi:hypothetical protein